MIKVSYFSSKAAREHKVSIAKWPPRFWKGERATKFAPSNPKAPDWESAYLRDLRMRFPNGFGLKEYLEEIEATTPNPILCCYEQNPSECHRCILAKYVYEHLKIDLEEWSNNGPKQCSLLD